MSFDADHGQHGSTPKVLVVDDHALFRVGLRILLDEQGVAVIGEASRGEDAVRLAAELRPDVVLMDLHMPGMSGVEATRRIAALDHAPPVLVLTGAEGNELLDVLLAGALGYLPKDAGPQRIADGIRAAALGLASIAPEVAGRLVDRLRELERARAAEDAPPPRRPLTPREEEVLRLLACGRDNVAIGSSLYISPSTVKHHVTAIMSKLGVENRVQAATAAVRLGVVS